MTPPELMQGGLVGLMRRVGTMKNGERDKSAPHSSWSTDIDSAIAEMAVSKYLGLYWRGHRGREDDVLDGREVRATIYETGKLVIRKRDLEKHASKFFVLVVAKPPIYSIRGEFLCADAKQDDYYEPEPKEGEPAWWVPQSDLAEFNDG
jgi:hypothetical protein